MARFYQIKLHSISAGESWIKVIVEPSIRNIGLNCPHVSERQRKTEEDRGSAAAEPHSTARKTAAAQMKEHFHQGDCSYGEVLIVLASISDGDVWLFSPCPQSVANRWRSSCGISESIFNEKQKSAAALRSRRQGRPGALRATNTTHVPTRRCRRFRNYTRTKGR